MTRVSVVRLKSQTQMSDSGFVAYTAMQREAGWGNALNVYYRVRAVSVDNVRSLPSATLNVHITNAAPVPSTLSVERSMSRAPTGTGPF